MRMEELCMRPAEAQKLAFDRGRTIIEQKKRIDALQEKLDALTLELTDTKAELSGLRKVNAALLKRLEKVKQSYVSTRYGPHNRKVA